MSVPKLDYPSVYGIECRTERRSHRSMFYINIFECSAACRTQDSIFKVFMVLNPELNIDPTARYSRLVFSNAKTNVDPIARN